MQKFNIDKIKTIKELDNFQKNINEEIANRRKFIENCCTADMLSKKSFGYIKESFESLSPMLFQSDEGKRILRKYMNTIKENHNLSSMYSLHENIRKANKDTDVDFFINQLTNTQWNINQKTLSEDTLTLGRILAEGYMLLGEKAKLSLPNENDTLSEAVNYLVKNKMRKNNIAEYSNVVKVIKENVIKQDNTLKINEDKNIDEITLSLLKEFNTKYSNELSQEEIIALQEISNSQNRESVFEDYKRKCSNKIAESKMKFSDNPMALERINNVIEQVNNKTYSLDTLGQDICGFIELSKIFE